MGAFKSWALPVTVTVVLDGEVGVVVFNGVSGVVVFAGGVAVVEQLVPLIMMPVPTAEVGEAWE